MDLPQTRVTTGDGPRAPAAPTVSVIIPLYNAADCLPRALDSVLAQRGAETEVIVVNDGSQDDGERVALSYGDRIRYFRQANAGPGAARNRGLREARATFIAFLDADDVWLPGRLEPQVDFLRTHPDVGLAAGNYRWVRGDRLLPPVWQLPVPSPWWVPDNTFAAFRDGYCPQASATTVRADVLRDAGGFPEDLRSGEDVLAWFRIGRRSRWAFGREVVAHHWHRAASITERAGFDTTNTETLFRRLRELAADTGDPADYAAWQDCLGRALNEYVKRAILARQEEAGRRYYEEWRRELRPSHRLRLRAMLRAAGLLRWGYHRFRGA